MAGMHSFRQIYLDWCAFRSYISLETADILAGFIPPCWTWAELCSAFFFLSGQSDKACPRGQIWRNNMPKPNNFGRWLLNIHNFNHSRTGLNGGSNA